MRNDILASVALAAMLAAAPAWAQSSTATPPAAPAQSHDSTKADSMKSTDSMKSDHAKPAAGSAAGSSSTTDLKPSTATGATTTTKPAVIAAQEPSQLTADHLIGMDVRNPQNDKIGEIEDLLLDADMRVVGVVVSAGGFLGMGDRNVALNRDQVQIVTRGERNERVATVNMTKEQLKAAPEFKTLARQRAETDDDRARQQQGATAGAGARPSTVPPTTVPPTKTQ